MNCPHCHARGIDIEMLCEDTSGRYEPVAGTKYPEVKCETFVAANYSCLNCLDEFRWTLYGGLRERE